MEDTKRNYQQELFERCEQWLTHYEKTIASGLNNMPVMLSDCLLDDLVMDLQQPQHAGFIGAHLAAEAHDVGEHDRGQLAGLGPCRL